VTDLIVDAPFIDLVAPDGARARCYLDGAQVASWIPAGATTDRLFVSERAQYGAGVSIRGGIPICFPQFGSSGPLRHHGFARLKRWTVVTQEVRDGRARATLRLTDDAKTRAEWPHAFTADLTVEVWGASLSVALEVTNRGTASCRFTAALHPYFRVDDAYDTVVHGLTGARYRDALQGGAECAGGDAPLAIREALDRVYLATADTLELACGAERLRIEKTGFPDTVVWNPGAEGTRSRIDFAPGDERMMVCVEAAAVECPIELAPGAMWRGVQRMTVLQ
jgi:glucose-6-phosphate 1-epimerase